MMAMIDSPASGDDYPAPAVDEDNGADDIMIEEERVYIADQME
jgi:hypothetical protein